jgi:MFS family permease
MTTSFSNTPTIKTLLGIWALFLACAFVQLGNGIQRILLPVRGESEGFSPSTMGLVMAFHFGGYLLGAKFAPVGLRSVGHIRVFSAMASLASIAVLMNSAFITPFTWCGIYLLGGLCNATILVVLESWLNDRATNENRGQILGSYMVVMLGGNAGGQLLANLGDAGGFKMFILSSVLLSLAIVPMTLSASSNPPNPPSSSMPFLELYKLVPSAVVGTTFASFVQCAMSSMAIVFAIEAGMSTSKATIFVSAGLTGAMLLQIPLGRLSDRFPRRKIILICIFTSAAIALFQSLLSNSSDLQIILNLTFGAFVFPLYGLFAALANDWIPSEKRVSASSTLVLASSIGSVIAPLLIGFLLGEFGPSSYFLTNASVLIFIGVYISYRTRVREPVPVDKQSPFVPLTARSGQIAHSLGRWIRNPLAVWPKERPDQDK